jgi:hypothetical protein
MEAGEGRQKRAHRHCCNRAESEDGTSSKIALHDFVPVVLRDGGNRYQILLIFGWAIPCPVPHRLSPRLFGFGLIWWAFLLTRV